MKQPTVYIMANQRNGTLYTGVTSDLIKRVYEHTTECEGFCKKYNCNQLVFYEVHETMETAIQRETQIKKGSRKKKITLIESMNREWKDLYNDIF